MRDQQKVEQTMKWFDSIKDQIVYLDAAPSEIQNLDIAPMYAELLKPKESPRHWVNVNDQAKFMYLYLRNEGVIPSNKTRVEYFCEQTGLELDECGIIFDTDIILTHGSRKYTSYQLLSANRQTVQIDKVLELLVTLNDYGRQALFDYFRRVVQAFYDEINSLQSKTS